jgi:nicotinamide-nucleotide amidase
MKASILAVGDELTCGYRLDTNSQAISRRLASVPIEVILHLTVGDDLEVIQRRLRTALEAADVVIITGGLGPTDDDLTRQAVADCFDLGLVENAAALTRLQERFIRRGRTMPESNLIQAQMPAGSQIILNGRGTAAGFYLPTDGKHIFVTPGIPYEMDGMLEGFILPRLRELVGDGHHVRRAALKVYGLPESGINERIRPMMARDRNPLLGLLPHRGTITIEVVANGATGQEAEALMEADLAALRAELGRQVISEDERDLPQVVADLLVERGLTIALVMANGIRQAGDADIGVGVGPIIIPEDSTPEQPYGAVHVAVNLRGQETCRKISFNGDRSRVREWAADAALALVRLWVLQQSQQ